MRHTDNYRVRAYHADGQGYYHFWVQAEDENDAARQADTWLNEPVPTAIPVDRIEVERVTY